MRLPAEINISVNNNLYLIDLSVRQNRPVTAAEVHLYLDARRFSNKEIEECTLIMKAMSEGQLEGQLGIKPTIKQLDLENNDIDKLQKRHTTPIERCNELEQELEKKRREIEQLKTFYTHELELRRPENFFVYQNKLALIDNVAGKKLVIKYKSDLFDELITEFKKLYDWLDSRCAILKFDIDGNNVMIDKCEINTVITFFHKLNSMKCDAND